LVEVSGRYPSMRGAIFSSNFGPNPLIDFKCAKDLMGLEYSPIE
jgi:hypothetical protein